MLMKMVCLELRSIANSLSAHKVSTNRKPKQTKTRHQLIVRLLTWCTWKEHVSEWLWITRRLTCAQGWQRELSLRGLSRVEPESGLGLLQGTSGVPTPSAPCDSLQQLSSFWGHPVMPFSHLIIDIHQSALLAAFREPRGSSWGAFHLWIVSSSSSKVKNKYCCSSSLFCMLSQTMCWME